MADSLPHVPTPEEQEVVTKTIQLFTQLYQWKTNLNAQAEEIASLIYPEARNTFMWGSYNWPGAKRTERMVDSTGMLALQQFASIMGELLTPTNIQWHQLQTTNPYLNKNCRVALYFEQVTNILFQERYAATSNFLSASYTDFLNLGAFGTMTCLIDELDDPVYGRQGIRYVPLPFGEVYLYQNHQGQVIGLIRYFRLTARQCWQMFGESNFPEVLKAPLEQNSEWQYEFLHHVGLREDWEPGKPGKKGMPWRSDYISLAGQTLLRQGSYRRFPYAVGRYTLAPREIYGRSPAMAILPSLKTINAEKSMFLKAGHRVADPVLLIQDDSLVDSINLRPGAINAGGVSPDGRPLVHPLPVGNIQIGIEMMEAEADIIKQSFLTSLFDILIKDRPTMTATEVLSRLQEKGTLIGPMVSRQAEFLGPMIDRELDILAWQKKLPPMPPELKEAGSEYRVEYTSLLNRTMRSGEAAGFLRTVESALSVVNATQDMSHLDVFDFDTALKDIADIQAVPTSWMANDKLIQSRRQQRAQAEQQRAQIQAAPAQAALMKAQAVIEKTRMQTGAGAPAEQPQAAPPEQQQQGAPAF